MRLTIRKSTIHIYYYLSGVSHKKKYYILQYFSGVHHKKKDCTSSAAMNKAITLFYNKLITKKKSRSIILILEKEGKKTYKKNIFLERSFFLE